MPKWITRLVFRSNENPRDRTISRLFEFLERDEDTQRMDASLREILKKIVGGFAADPSLSEKRLGENLQEVVFKMFPQEEPGVHRVLSQIHSKRSLEGNQQSWDGIVLVKLLRIIEQETGSHIFH